MYMHWQMHLAKPKAGLKWSWNW